MKRLVVASVLALAACSRPTPPAARPAAHPTASPGPARVVDPGTTAAVMARPAAEPGGEHEEVMNPVEAMSPYPSTPAGAEALAVALAHEAIHRNADGLARAVAHLDADPPRYELALTEQGSAAALRTVLPDVSAARAALVQRLSTLHEPVQVTVASAAGGELSDGAAHGLDPRMLAIRASLRPLVRFYRVEVSGAEGSGHVVIEPLAYLAGQWTYLGALWSGNAPVAPMAPVGPVGHGVATAR